MLTEADGRRRRRYLLRGTKEAVLEDEVLTREEQASNFVDGIKGGRFHMIGATTQVSPQLAFSSSFINCCASILQAAASCVAVLNSSSIWAGFFLPKGYPDTVTPDYLRFQLWAVPAHVTGWMSTSLATSSLLKAVGVSNSAVGAASAAAAIKWITKDGIGAAGRVLVRGFMALVLRNGLRGPKRGAFGESKTMTLVSVYGVGDATLMLVSAEGAAWAVYERLYVCQSRSSTFQ